VGLFLRATGSWTHALGTWAACRRISSCAASPLLTALLHSVHTDCTVKYCQLMSVCVCRVHEVDERFF